MILGSKILSKAVGLSKAAKNTKRTKNRQRERERELRINEYVEKFPRFYQVPSPCVCVCVCLYACLYIVNAIY